MMWIANAASGFGLSSRPSSIISLAPNHPSSPGWNMNRTVPASESRFAHSRRAADASIAVCVSWPQACIVPATVDLNGTSVSSGIGSASMSPRKSTVRPGLPPRRTATAPVVEEPVFHSSGNPASEPRTLAIVFGVCRPSSGSAWIARRSATVSACTDCAASIQPRVASTTSFMQVSSEGGERYYSRMGDRARIYAASFLRALANGLAGVVLGIYLAKLGHSVVTLGLVLSAGLAGATLATAIVTFYGDRFGRRRALVPPGALGAGGGLVVALSSDAAVIAAGAFLGMLTGMGKDRGAMLALESATLPSSTDDAGRTRAFAWHAVLQDAGQALGGLLAVLPSVLRDAGLAGEIPSYRVTILLYAALIAASLPWYATLSARSDPPAAPKRAISPRSRSILWKICALFSIDGVGGGFLGSALFSYFFFAFFGATEPQIALLFLAG